jgi:transposase
LGKPLQIILTGGQRHEATVAEELVEYAQGKIFLGDTAYDGQKIRDKIASKGLQAVIRPHPSRSLAPGYDKHLYKERHLVEVFFNRIKHFRRIATRYEKTARNFLSMIYIACLREWLF